MKEYDFIIVGAGLAGLSAHHALIKKGYSVLTLEQSSIPGGRVRTEKIGNGFSDCGAQFFTFNYPAIVNLLKELGLEGQKASNLMGHKLQDKDLLVNAANPMGAVTSGLLPLSSFFRLMSHIAFLKLTKRSVKEESPETLADVDEGNALAYCKRHLDDEIISKIIIPYFSAFNYASPEELSSALVVRALLHMASGKSLMGLSGGLVTLPNALARGKEIQFETDVLSINGDIVETSRGSFSGKHIIVATTPSVAQKLLSERFPSSLAVPSSPSAHEAFLVKKKKRSGAYGTLVSPEKNKDINVLTDERYKATGLAPDDLDLLGVLCSREGALKENIKGETFLLGISESDIIERKKTIWKEAIPLLRPGHFRAIRDYRKSLSAQSTILLVGDYLSTGCAEGAVESGQFVAGLFASRL